MFSTRATYLSGIMQSKHSVRLLEEREEETKNAIAQLSGRIGNAEEAINTKADMFSGLSGEITIGGKTMTYDNGILKAVR